MLTIRKLQDYILRSNEISSIAGTSKPRMRFFSLFPITYATIYLPTDVLQTAWINLVARVPRRDCICRGVDQEKRSLGRKTNRPKPEKTVTTAAVDDPIPGSTGIQPTKEAARKKKKRGK